MQAEAIWQSSPLSSQPTESGRKGPWNHQPVASVGTTGLVASSLSLAFPRMGHRVMCPQQMKSVCVLGPQRQSSILVSYQDEESLGFTFTEKNLSVCPTMPHFLTIPPQYS